MFQDDQNNNADNIKARVDTVKATLADSKKVAKLLLNKAEGGDDSIDKNLLQLLQYQTLYKTILEHNLCNFSEVIHYLMSIVGYETSYHLDNLDTTVDVPKVFKCLESIIEDSDVDSEHLQIIVEFLTTPNIRVIPYHDLRLILIDRCFEKEITRLTKNQNFNTACFRKLRNCFTYVDESILNKKIQKYVLPHLVNENQSLYIYNLLQEINSDKEITGSNYNSFLHSLQILQCVFEDQRMTDASLEALKTYLVNERSATNFCDKEISRLLKILH